MKSLCFGLICLLCCTVLAWAEGTTAEESPDPPQNEPEVLTIVNNFDYVDNETEADANYGLGLFKMNWFEADLYCASKGFTLASIPSAAEQLAITTFIRGKVDNTEPVWTSGTNQAVVSKYMWQNKGTRIGYSNFLSNPRTNAYYCVTLNGLTGVWSTDDCRTKRYFLCEKKCT